MPRPEPKLENLVVLVVWASAVNRQIPGSGYGHAALWIPHHPTNYGTYISLWPADQPSFSALLDGTGGPMSQRPNFHSYLRDKAAEGNKEPDFTFCLYCLDAAAIIKEFDRTRATTKEWRLYGNMMAFIGSENTRADSCSSLCYRLLEHGGMVKSSSLGSIISPDDLCLLVQQERKAELNEGDYATKIAAFPPPKNVKEMSLENLPGKKGCRLL